MNRTSIRRVVVPTLASLALGLGLTACGAGNEEPASGSEGTSESGDSLSGTLSLGGASSQEAAQNAWRAAFQGLNPEVTVNYDPIGSGGGREQFISGGFPMAGSDSYLTDEEGELKAATERCEGEAPIEVPNYVSPIAVIYNLEGVEDLQLSPETLAGIFAGEITEWDDEAIAGDNPDAELPAETINPVHRSDESGTTGNFTNYLSTVAPDAWTFGEVEEWPIDSGEGASGTSGVVEAVTQGANSIGYADASQAGDLGVGPHRGRRRVRRPRARGRGEDLRGLPARRERHRHPAHLRPRLRDRGGRHLPDRADVVPHGLPVVRRRRRG